MTQILGEPGWLEPEPNSKSPSWSTGSRAGTHPAAPRQELILRHCQAAGTKGHFYKCCYLCHQPCRVNKPVRVLLFPASSACLFSCCWGWSLTAGAETWSHHICSSTLIQEQFRNYRMNVSNLWFTHLKNASISVSISRQGSRSLPTNSFQYLLQTLQKQVRNLEGLEPRCLQTTTDTLFFFC